MSLSKYSRCGIKPCFAELQITFDICPSVFYFVFFANTDDSKVDCHGSSKPGNRSFGRFSRPLLEVYFTGGSSHEQKLKSLAVAEIFRYCKGFRLSYSYFCILDQKYKRGLLDKFFSKTDVKTYPTVYLSEVADFLQGLTYSPSDVKNSGYLVLRSSNIQNGMLSFDDCVYVDKSIPESLQVKCADVIMCVRNGSKSLVGKTALISNDMPMTTWGAFMMIVRSQLNDTYIFHYLNSQMFFSQVFKDTGTATINQITKGILNECKLPIPPVEERRRCKESA